MKNTLFVIALFSCVISANAQVRPDQAIEKTTAEDTDEIYSQYNGLLRRIKFSTAKTYFQTGLTLLDLGISDGTSGQVLTTDGSGNFSFTTVSGGGPGGTDDQTLSFAGTTLSIEDGNSVDLSSLQDGTGTDDQTIDVFSLAGTTLSLSLESDGQAAQTVDLSSLQDGTGTDDQTSVEVSHSPSGDLTSANVGAALNEIQTQVSAIQTLTGRSDGDTNFGTLTGTLLPDNSDAVTIFNTVDNELLKLQPITESITSGSTTMTLYGGNRYNKYHIIDMTSASTSVAVVVTMSTSAILSASTHTFHFQNTATGQEVTFPSTFLKMDGTQIGTKAIETDQQFTCYFDGTSLYCETE